MTKEFQIGDKVKVIGLGPVMYDGKPLYDFHGDVGKIEKIGGDRLYHHREEFYGMVVNTKQIDGETFYGLDTQDTADVSDVKRNNEIFLGSYFPASDLEYADEKVDLEEFGARFERFCGGVGVIGGLSTS